jgi:large subunit ribosomal protein L15
MSSRIRSIISTASCITKRPWSTVVSKSVQCVQYRFASILSSISDNPGAYNKRIRRGRGPGSGKGKASGRGHGGQKQHGKVPFGFQGGQKSYIETHGKRGFKNVYVIGDYDS